LRRFAAAAASRWFAGAAASGPACGQELTTFVVFGRVVVEAGEDVTDGDAVVFFAAVAV
jgi:hypothetical protein